MAPLTATVLADADEKNAGIASGVNNAIARAAGLLGVAVMGAVVAAQFTASIDQNLDRSSLSPPALAALETAEDRTLARADVSGLPADEAATVAQATEQASLDAFHIALAISAGLVALGGVLGLVFVRDPRREVRCEGCPGGQLVGAPAEAVRERDRGRARVAPASHRGPPRSRRDASRVRLLLAGVLEQEQAVVAVAGRDQPLAARAS